MSLLARVPLYSSLVTLMVLLTESANIIPMNTKTHFVITWNCCEWNGMDNAFNNGRRILDGSGNEISENMTISTTRRENVRTYWNAMLCCLLVVCETNESIQLWYESIVSQLHSILVYMKK